MTSSIAAVAPGPYHATYAASKAFVHSFAEGIRVELKDDPRDVAGEAVQALLAGQASVITGSVRNRVGAEIGTHLPTRSLRPWRRE